MKYVPDFKINTLCESDFQQHDNRNRVMSVIDDISLELIHGEVKNIVHDISNLRIANLQRLCIVYIGKKKILKKRFYINTIKKNRRKRTY